MKNWAKAAVFAAAIACSQLAHAEAMQKFQFTGTVTYSTYLASLGSTISGTFTYAIENMSPKKQIADWGGSGFIAQYGMGVPSGITARVGAHTITASGLSVAVFDNLGTNFEDMVRIGSWGEFTGVPGIVLDGTTYSQGYLALELASKSGNTSVLKDLRLPRRYDVSLFDGSAVGVVSFDSNLGDSGWLLAFRIDSISSLDD